MGRSETAYLLLALMAAVGFLVIHMTIRYNRYQQAIRHGHRPEKRVWKPFWLL